MPKPSRRPRTYQEHKQKWKSCQRCLCCEGRTQVVLARGDIPADIVFIGEAPGISEDTLGRPFVGPAGQLLDHIIAASEIPDAGIPYVITNLIACIPLDGNDKIREPPEEAIKSCSPRLEELLKLAKPKAIVAVGKVAAKHTATIREDLPFYDLVHPAAILRSPVAGQSLAIKRCIVELQQVMREL